MISLGAVPPLSPCAINKYFWRKLAILAELCATARETWVRLKVVGLRDLDILRAIVRTIDTRRPLSSWITGTQTSGSGAALLPLSPHACSHGNRALSSDPRASSLQGIGAVSVDSQGSRQGSEDAGRWGDGEGQKGAKSPTPIGGGSRQEILERAGSHANMFEQFAMAVASSYSVQKGCKGQFSD